MYKLCKNGKNINTSVTKHRYNLLNAHKKACKIIVGGKVFLKMNKKQNNEARKLPGFYIAVCCCVLAIGAAGYFTRKGQEAKQASSITEMEENSSYTASLPTQTAMPTKIPIESIPEMPHPTAEAVIETSAGAVVPIDDYTLDNPDLEASVTVSAEETVSFIKPVSGEVLAQYSDTPIYNSALDDWRTHNGVDIAAQIGASVCAAEDGTIKQISYDAMGCVITITHNDGYESRYMQLESAEDLKEGDAVKKGDVIGIIGKSTAESVTDSHLHFEILKDGTPQNPAEVMQ